MLKVLVLAALLPVAALAQGAPGGTAPATDARQAQQAALADRLWRVMRMDGMMQVVRDEAVTEAERLAAEGVIAGAGLPWPKIVTSIHDPADLGQAFRDGLEDALPGLDEDLVGEGLNFYDSPLGRRLLALESSARLEMLDPDVEARAREAFMRDLSRDGDRSSLIRRIIREADLVTPNVVSGLNATMAFSQGFAEGGGYDMPPDSGQMAAEAWAQQEQIEADAAAWLEGFLMAAYADVDDDDMRTYAEFAISDRGRSLANALFAGFDRVFVETSYRMGFAAAIRGDGREL